MEETRAKLVVLISGSGSNLQAIIDACLSGDIPATISAVISNKPGVLGLDRASKAGIPTRVIEHQNFPDRESFDQALAEIIDPLQVDLVILAGFMRILSPRFVRHFAGRLINIHPSLLPKYPGLHTHQRAIDAGDSETGATVHFVTEQLDGGPPIIQASVAIDEQDNADKLAKLVLSREHIIYPLAIKWICQGRITMKGNKVLLNGDPVPASGHLYTEQ